MNKKEPLDQAKSNKSNAIINALLIGIMIGVVIWSVVQNTVGLFTLVPLYFAYRLLNNPTNDKTSKDQSEE